MRYLIFVLCVFGMVGCINDKAVEWATDSSNPIRVGLTSATASTPKGVDCNVMCSRTFKACVEDVMLVSGKLTRKQLSLIRRAGAMSKMQEKGYEACMKSCKQKKGVGSDAGKINKCLRTVTCGEYAKCIKKHLK